MLKIHRIASANKKINASPDIMNIKMKSNDSATDNIIKY